MLKRIGLQLGFRTDPKFLLAASPNVRPGGDGNPPGNISIEPPKSAVGDDGDELVG